MTVLATALDVDAIRVASVAAGHAAEEWVAERIAEREE
jgi:hypothetical protein